MAPSWSVYVLCDPDTEEVRYVGKTKTKNLLNRYKEHMRDGTDPNVKTSKAIWIRDLLAVDSKPLLRTVQTVTESDDEACKAEMKWISTLRSQGVSLTNSTDGGIGLRNPSVDVRDRIGDSVRLIATPERRARLSEAAKRIMADPKRRAKQAEIGRAITANPVHRAKLYSQEVRSKISRAVSVTMKAALDERARQHLTDISNNFWNSKESGSERERVRNLSRQRMADPKSRDKFIEHLRAANRRRWEKARAANG